MANRKHNGRAPMPRRNPGLSLAREFRARANGLQPGFCPEGRVWVKGRSLVQFWRDCQRGNWMLYWLERFSDLSGKDQAWMLKQLLRRFDTSGAQWVDGANSVGVNADIAAFLRHHFTPTGRRRAR